MSALKDQLQGDLTEAMRAQDELTMATIRMALAAITTAVCHPGHPPTASGGCARMGP